MTALRVLAIALVFAGASLGWLVLGKNCYGSQML